MSLNGAIGKNGDIPWKIPGEQGLFKEFTEGKIVVMGRATWNSIPEKYRPLPNRINMMLTSTPDYSHSNCIEIASIEEALLLAEAITEYDELVFIGGQRVYEEGLPYCDTLYLTQIDGIYSGDRFFPKFNREEWGLVEKRMFTMEENGVADYTFKILQRA